MRLTIPPVFSVSRKTRTAHIQGVAKQMALIEGSFVKFTTERNVWIRFTPALENGEVIHLFRRAPIAENIPPEDGILISPDFPIEVGQEIDASQGSWLQLPVGWGEVRQEKRANQVLSSWNASFRYVDESNAEKDEVFLRKPQIGALHAIHAHWAVSDDVATIVMPTGTGKTETMLATAVSAKCEKILVIVPTDALRSQIAEKFLSLGILAKPGSKILAPGTLSPVVGILSARPKTEAEVDDVFEHCNVVVTTSTLAAGCKPEIVKKIASLSSHLFIDEAHHAEAPTWKEFKENFAGKRILQFTATPFREDDRRIDGKIIFVYPLRKAQNEGYFQKIRFSPVSEFAQSRADLVIAEKAIFELDQDKTKKHVVMARVSSIERAREVYEIYRGIGRYNPVLMHSQIGSKDREKRKQLLRSGQSRIVVCVDMLGEGFDMPELKIAAFHDLRKSLAVTLQLAGRFTRTRADLGSPVFIANTASLDLREELERLYSQDPDWNQLLPELSETAIAEELGAQEFMAGFAGNLGGIPIKEITPSASTVVYRTECANWTPKRFKLGRGGASRFEQFSSSINEKDCTLVVVTASRQAVPWTNVAIVQDYAWDLYLAYWDRELQLLFIHGSNNGSEFKDLARSLCGESVSLVVDPVVYRVFHGIKRMLLVNVGLDEHFGRHIKFTARMGADVGSRLSQSTKRGAKKAVLTGIGYEMGERLSVGAAKRGRVWSAQRLRVDTFAQWCRWIGKKIVDETIDPDEVLEGTLIPKQIDSRPVEVAIGVDWPSVVLDVIESQTTIIWPSMAESKLTDVGIELVEGGVNDPLRIRVFTNNDEVAVRLEIFKVNQVSDFRFVYDSGSTAIIRRSGEYDLCEFLTENAPTIWFANGSSLEGNLLVELVDTIEPYPVEKIEVLDWAGVDIQKESQKKEKRKDSIQYRIIRHLREKGGYDVIFDDDDAGEAADVVTVRLDDAASPKVIYVEFYHCKFSASGNAGGRVDDLYVVCGQAQRSIVWLHSRDKRKDLFDHLLKRNQKRIDAGQPSRFEVGDEPRLLELRELCKRADFKLSVFAVQPGVSKKKVSVNQLTLLSVVERYLQETYQLDFRLICHE